MTIMHSRARFLALATCTIAFGYSINAHANDGVADFSTRPYATGLRTKEMKNIMDTDGDGTISRAEWDAYHEKVFYLLDSHKRGKLSVSVFADRTAMRLGSDFATGGYVHGLASAELAHKIDSNGDGWISREEWMTYQERIFDLMNTSVTHKDKLGDNEMFDFLKSGNNTR